jgi:hypothetical protein
MVEVAETSTNPAEYRINYLHSRGLTPGFMFRDARQNFHC